jgi:hypothetical protein
MCRAEAAQKDRVTNQSQKVSSNMPCRELNRQSEQNNAVPRRVSCQVQQGLEHSRDDSAESCEYSCSIQDLFGFLFNDEIEDNSLAVLYRAFIDDSADKKRDAVVISGALIGSATDWQTLTARWKNRLQQDNFAYFKSSECNWLEGQFAKFRDPIKYPSPTGRDAAETIRTDLEEIIRTSPVKGIGVVIPVDVYRKMYSDVRFQSFLSRDP